MIRARNPLVNDDSLVYLTGHVFRQSPPQHLARRDISSFAMRASPTLALCSFAPSTSKSRVKCTRGSKLRTSALSPDDEKLYFTLGVSPGASQEAVKRAYKRLAKQFHPDVSDAPDAEVRFNEISTAYQRLCEDRGMLANVGSDEWREKWSAQLRTMREVEKGATKVNVRRRRVVRAARGVGQEEASDSDASGSATQSQATQRQVEDLERALRDDDDEEDVSPEESQWQREQEMQWAVRAQLGGLRDRERRRRRVTPTEKGKFVEPFADISRTAHDDEWNHTVQ